MSEEGENTLREFNLVEEKTTKRELLGWVIHYYLFTTEYIFISYKFNLTESISYNHKYFTWIPKYYI